MIFSNIAQGNLQHATCFAMICAHQPMKTFNWFSQVLCVGCCETGYKNHCTVKHHLSNLSRFSITLGRHVVFKARLGLSTSRQPARAELFILFAACRFLSYFEKNSSLVGLNFGLCIYVSMYVCMYVCMYLSMYWVMSHQSDWGYYTALESDPPMKWPVQTVHS